MILHKIIKLTSPTLKTLYNIRKKAIERWYDLKVNIKILASYIQNNL